MPARPYRPLGRPAPGEPFAVIDLGSNSGRVVVARRAAFHRIEILADGRAPLRLARGLNRAGELSADTIDRVIAALNDFKRLIDGAGASRVALVATSAIREARNGRALLARIGRELEFHARVLSGEREALAAFRGAVHGVPAERGLVIDLGGGSLEVVQFRRRRPGRAWTLPLGALRLSDRFLAGNPPTEREQERLARHVRETLQDAGVPPLAQGDVLIGTGGTIRNLAKIDRRRRAYPIPRLHGYVLSRGVVQELARRVAGRAFASRGRIAGLNRDRADSIVGGAIAIETALWTLGAPELVVSGEGTREGLVYQALRAAPPPIASVRRESLNAACARFSSWHPRAADRRERLARRIARVVAPELAEEYRAALSGASRALDIGRSVDYYNRHRHAANVLLATDLGGYSHRELALLAAVTLVAGEDEPDLKQFAPLVTNRDAKPIGQAAAIVALADEWLHRLPDGAAARLKVDWTRTAIRIHAREFGAWRSRDLPALFRSAFGRELKVGRRS